MPLIYITCVGRSAVAQEGKYLEPIYRRFNPDHVILLASKDLIHVIEPHLKRLHPKQHIQIVTLDNPFYGERDYCESLTHLTSIVSDLYLTYLQSPNADPAHFKVILNNSGGTTKFMNLISDLHTILSFAMKTEMVWGFFDKQQNKLIFTTKPDLTNILIKKLIEEGAIKSNGTNPAKPAKIQERDKVQSQKRDSSSMGPESIL